MAVVPFSVRSPDEEAQNGEAHANRIAIIGQLAASIVHEVCQPISATLLNARIALESMGDPCPDIEQVRVALGRIIKESGRASKVVSAIHALAKKRPPHRQQCQLNDLILEVIEVTHIVAVDNFVSITTQFADFLPPVLGDRIQLQQVVLNLVINAIEAMHDLIDAPRRLLIQTNSDETRVWVSVRDSGHGLAEGCVGRLFQSFYTTKADGLGVGLSICKHIIESHHGSIWAAQNKDRGATFAFSLLRGASY